MTGAPMKSDQEAAVTVFLCGRFCVTMNIKLSQAEFSQHDKSKISRFRAIVRLSFCRHVQQSRLCFWVSEKIPCIARQSLLSGWRAGTEGLRCKAGPW